MAVKDSDGISAPRPGEWDGRVLSAGYVADYKPFNFVDGEGVRCSLYVSGCPFKCPGCYNAAAQSFRYGKPYTPELEERIMDDLAQPYVAGLSLVGGEPMLSAPILLPLVRRVRERFGDAKDIWIWSGYTYEQLLAEQADKRELLEACDVLVDGPFIKRLYHHDLAFRGSSNQRIIDLRLSRDDAGQLLPEPALWSSGRRDTESSVEFVQPAAPRS
ncbi:anaerobic ribonucleoside-triphosphate reductase activating protein [Trueperella bialowiezensis]|uniref:Anaerobic ribonucleotide reductase-activating protein n=1 Tax=Trueperella bialowiezensis TaxID=312285 RepID=A0A3S4WGJ4_9ACTO|nr:anaerobic ribonucleoside-triphosphate reductase activating protein [Trueperella bialowiezensis]VEI13410.1 anaerobic ribonucleotide reductase-activating protein [Trueperella bialowiezensis]